MMRRLAATIGAEFRPGLAERALLIVLPLALLALATHQEIWLRAAVASISVFIGVERADLAPLGALLHGLVILACFFALFMALTIPPLFVAGCALLAMAALSLTRWGGKFRSLGNFTFIPALYLACETAEDPSPAGPLAQGLAVLPFLAVALLPPLLVVSLDHARRRPAGTGWGAHFSRILAAPAGGQAGHWRAGALTVACAVGLAATLVEAGRLGHGQWVIWSAASVVTGDWHSARQKLGQRALGAAIGVPLGAAIGLVLPHTLFVYGFAALGAIVTLVAFKHYTPAFTARCACAALALVAIAQSATAAASRAENVLLGGGIGIFTVLIGHLAARHAERRQRL